MPLCAECKHYAHDGNICVTCNCTHTSALFNKEKLKNIQDISIRDFGRMVQVHHAGHGLKMGFLRSVQIDRPGASFIMVGIGLYSAFFIHKSVNILFLD